MQTDIQREQFLNTDSLITTTTLHLYTDGTTCTETKKEIISAGKTEKPEITKTIKVTDADKWKLIFWEFLLGVIFTMSYGPLAAFLVEMFPLKIRYTSMSLPYHVGYGIFGGLLPAISTYLVTNAKDNGDVHFY